MRFHIPFARGYLQSFHFLIWQEDLHLLELEHHFPCPSWNSAAKMKQRCRLKKRKVKLWRHHQHWKNRKIWLETLMILYNNSYFRLYQGYIYILYKREKYYLECVPWTWKRTLTIANRMKYQNTPITLLKRKLSMEYSNMQELADPNIGHPFQEGKQRLFYVFSKWH